MRKFPSGCLAVIAVALTLILGVGGGCYIGAVLTPQRRDYEALQWAVYGALIGGAAGLMGGLLWAFEIVRKRADRSNEEER